MRRADRLFQLVQLLRTRRFATAEQLASELEVSTRTVYRDVRDLQLSGVPINGEAGVGYQLQRGFELPPLTFNSAEIEALVLGARVVETWADAELATASRTAMTKLQAVLPETLRRLVADTLIFAPGGPRAQSMADSALGLLRRAVAERRKVRFSYRRADGEGSRRTVRPLGLHFWGTKWSLASWCELRQDYRNFRPDRMREVELTDGFDTTDEVSLAGFLKATEEQSKRDGYDLKIIGAGPRR